MDNITSYGLLRGRPFRGVCVLWHKSLGSAVSCVDCSENSRVVIIKIEIKAVGYCALDCICLVMTTVLITPRS